MKRTGTFMTLPEIAGGRALVLAASAALLSLAFSPPQAGAQATKVQVTKVQVMTTPTSAVLARAASGPLSCEIRRAGMGSAADLTAVVAGMGPSSGKADFLVLKSGTAGSSTIRQSHRFTLDAGSEAVVGHARIGLEQGARLSVNLAVKTDDGIECRTTTLLEP